MSGVDSWSVYAGKISAGIELLRKRKICLADFHALYPVECKHVGAFVIIFMGIQIPSPFVFTEKIWFQDQGLGCLFAKTLIGNIYRFPVPYCLNDSGQVLLARRHIFEDDAVFEPCALIQETVQPQCCKHPVPYAHR